MSQFFEKFNELTQNRFDYMKIVSADVALRTKSITINFIYPEVRQNEVFSFENEIVKAAEQALNSNARVEVKLKMSHFDKSFFYNEFLDFLKKYPSIISDIEEGDVTICDTPGKFSVAVSLHRHILEYCTAQNVLASIKEYLSGNFCEHIDVALTQKEETEELRIENFQEKPKTRLEDESGRFITAQNTEDFIGQIIYEKANYIEDAVSPKTGLVLCGVLTSINEFKRKPKTEGEEQKVFYRMTIEDLTGHIDFLYFPTKNSKDKISLLKTGKEIIVRGSLEIDKKDNLRLVYIVKDICLCTIPKDFKINRIRRIVEKDYLYVRPHEYVSSSQSSIFDKIEKTPSFLLNKTFVVFDIETTGLNPMSDKIIEIGAVKIENGKFTEMFSSFVDPLIPIPERITNLTGITDIDVINKPKIEEVLIDFYKFVENTNLVAQNIQFDYSFISFYGKPLNIFFDNHRYDTLLLARKYYPKLPNYKLETLAEKFSVDLRDAHRAVNDAVATAKIFVELAKLM